MHLCKDMHEVLTTHTDNTQIFMKRVLKYSASVSIIARDSNRVAQTSCEFQVFDQNQENRH